MFCEGGNFQRIAGDPAYQIDCVATAADNSMALGGLPPAGGAGDLGVVVGIFGFDKEDFSDGALADQLDGIVKGVGVTANLTDHQHLAGLLLRFDHGAAIFDIQSHRLFAQNVLTGHQCFYCGLTMGLIVGDDNDSLDVIPGQNVVIISVMIQIADVEGRVMLVQTGLIQISDGYQLRLSDARAPLM